jgi:hypothetical protein
MPAAVGMGPALAKGVFQLRSRLFRLSDSSRGTHRSHTRPSSVGSGHLSGERSSEVMLLTSRDWSGNGFTGAGSPVSYDNSLFLRLMALAYLFCAGLLDFCCLFLRASS